MAAGVKSQDTTVPRDTTYLLFYKIKVTGLISDVIVHERVVL